MNDWKCLPPKKARVVSYEQRHRKMCVTRFALTWYNQPHTFSKLHNEDYLPYCVSSIAMKG